VKETREKKDKDKSRLRFWEMAGSKMAAVTGLTNEEAAAAAEKEAQEVRAKGALGKGRWGAMVKVLS
jgi:pre-mRNA-splicing factor ATP-dependent RNA helicase DHX38/PRP16